MNKKSLYIRTFGCQMNVRDSEFVMALMMEEGFTQASSIEDADVILFNSCSIRKHAEDRLISNIADLKPLKKKRPGVVIGLMGCTAQSYKDEILKKIPILDFSCGPGNESDIPGIVKDILENRCPVIAIDKVNEKRPELFPEYREGRSKAFISIGQGCDNYCSYCIVPYVRGHEKSRDARDILKEAEALARRGFKEITLLGQNVNSYKSADNKNGFVGLLESLNAIKGIERIRFMTSHPKDASTELFKAMTRLEKVCEHLHLPLQSGSDKILKMMNRRYTRKKYLKLVEDYRSIVPGGSITTDVIVGFPSETDKDFKDTFRLMNEVRFDSAFTFKYSPRPPAKSSQLKDNVPSEVKDARLKALMDIQCESSLMRNEELIGNAVAVLADCRNEKHPSTLTGRTKTNKTVVFEGNDKLIGTIVDVKIESVKPHTLIGRIC
ncbi:MAG: tRNA (N6-isopentenyl adenosine(37)-C2)-methylthiotransferase MiaB [Candidatus Omnitrophota bacterium]|jgi:tRNA-2-methylthio-N6-dimethylallyladenosine synthase